MDPKLYKLNEKIANLKHTDLLPFNENSALETREFLQKIVDILLDYVEVTFNRDSLVVDFHQPQCLKDKLDLKVPQEGVPLRKLVEDCVMVLKYGVKSGHPHFMNQLSCGLDIISMAGEWLTAAANCNMFTYEVAPVFTIMEHHVLKKMRRIIGFQDGDSIMAPGGTLCNMYAVFCARFKKFPEYKEKGPDALPGTLCIFISDQGHFSFKSACNVAGLGTDNCIHVKTDSSGRMIPEELEESILAAKACGKIPLMVVATSGTTVFGAFDPINEIADIAEKHDLWFHVDVCFYFLLFILTLTYTYLILQAAWGGGLMLSKTHRKGRFDGIDRAKSVTWNPHKLMGTTLQCATFHCSESGLLEACNREPAEYLFMTDKFYDTKYDTGDRVVQCGRHNDVFKLWLQFRARGEKGFEERMERLMELADYHVKRIKENSDKFHLLMEPEFVNICFWYIPKRLRGLQHDEHKMAEMGKICPMLKARMMKAGTLMIGYQRDDKIPNFFRTIISQEAINEKDIDFLIEEMDRLGEDL
jgi:glutamate decarboxylase